jgi:PIN domain nuclease of toxin-antitoxin system
MKNELWNAVLEKITAYIDGANNLNREKIAKIMFEMIGVVSSEEDLDHALDRFCVKSKTAQVSKHLRDKMNISNGAADNIAVFLCETSWSEIEPYKPIEVTISKQELTTLICRRVKDIIEKEFSEGRVKPSICTPAFSKNIARLTGELIGQMLRGEYRID